MTRSTDTTNTHRRRMHATFAFTALCLAGGAAALLGRHPAAAQDAPLPRIFNTAPVGVVRGQTLRNIFFLPAVQRSQAVECELIAMDMQGRVFARTHFPLAPGSSMAADISVLGDGSVRFNGRRLDVTVRTGSPLEIVPCISVRNLPRNVSLFASAQCVNNLPGGTRSAPVALGRTTYVLPYGEQESPETDRPGDNR